MKHTWRWFGPHDAVLLDEIDQAGAHGIVSALDHLPNGHIWTIEEIKKRQSEISNGFRDSRSRLEWQVVESLPVSEEIKKQDADWREHVENYKASLTNLAECGLEVVCYNFMPVLDWTRTDLAWELANGARCMRFDLIDFAVFDIHLLRRKGAAESYAPEIVDLASERIGRLDDGRKDSFVRNVVAGLPGASQNLELQDVADLLESYTGIGSDILRSNLHAFLELVIPTAEKLGLRMCCHPDDPPFPLLGLPRIMSTESDFKQLVEAVDSPANGITLCSGSLGAHANNNLPGMMKRLGNKVHFLHLRNVALEELTSPCSFYESDHLEGSVDMVALIDAILDEESRRKSLGRTDLEIPMRPDHGQELLDDLARKSQPGYTAIGRLKGLAELRGVEKALLQLKQAK